MLGELTHAQLDTFELGLEYTTDSTVPKATRAAALIGQIFDGPEPDPVVLEMLNYIYVDSPGAQWRRESSNYKQLKKRLLDPHGITLGDEGFELPGTTNAQPSPSRPLTDHIHQVTAPQEDPVPIDPSPTRDLSRVFIVHGQDTRPVNVLTSFLLFIGLRPMAWSDARALTGNPQPHTYDIVRAGMAGAGAIIVIFSPDDQARLDPRFTRPGAADEPVSGQPRQNVLLEAGIAFATDPGRTIFVQSETTRPISDISGFNWVSLDGSYDERKDLYGRLRDAQARVAPEPLNFLDPHAGPFKVE